MLAPFFIKAASVALCLKHESDVKNFDVNSARFSAARSCIPNAFGLPKS